MNEEKYEDLVLSHDKHIDIMSSSIEHLAQAVSSTNSKLEDVIEVMGAQNVFIERMNNMDTNIREYVTRSDKESEGIATRLEAVEENNKAHLSPATLKWIVGGIVLYSIMFGTYVVEDLHRIDTTLISKTEKCEGADSTQASLNKELFKDIARLERAASNNYHYIKAMAEAEE